MQKKVKAQKAQVTRLRALRELALDLGLSPSGRYRLGLTAARTEAIKVQPVRSEERALEVASILAEVGAIPSMDAKPEHDEGPPAEPVEAEVVELHPVGPEVSA